MQESEWLVADGGSPRDIRERTFEFALAIVKFCRPLESRYGVYRDMGRQQLRSGTSIGANVEEAQAGQSRADFINKYAVALKEARETIYWLRLLQAADAEEAMRRQNRDGETYERLRGEANEIARIIGAIIVSTKSRNSG